GELVIAELLDHADTQNAGVYIKNIPEHVKKLDEAVGFQLAPYAQAFVGALVDSERDAHRGNDPTSRIRTEMGQGVGTCGEHGFCGANVPIPCYTCMHFQPWLDGPHEDVYQGLLNERERVKEITGDIQIAAVLDRSIIALADVIMRCAKRREELS
ncbi:TPA: recombinase, partial [Escherichia coli]|nr:recombinase [Escherichia coli]